MSKKGRIFTLRSRHMTAAEAKPPISTPYMAMPPERRSNQLCTVVKSPGLQRM